MPKITWKLLRTQLLFNCFIEVKDPRVKGRCSHPLINIVVIVICALVSGAQTWQAMELFAKERKRWLSQFINLSNGIPSHYTISRTISLIDPESLRNCFEAWVNQICELIEDDIIALDGKTIRGSSHKIGNKKAAHIISAFSVRKKITLAETTTPEKSNEIRGIPILLNKLNIQNQIITIDAMGTQKGIAKLIRKKQGNYVLALKENHKCFSRKVSHLFCKAESAQFKNMVFRRWGDKNYNHGRLEHREYTILPVMYLHKYKSVWKDLSLFVQVKSTREHANGETEKMTKYFISSLPFKKYHKAGQAIRQHWSIENTLHWKLDVGMHEDDCQIYRGHAPENLATMRKVVLFLLQSENTSKAGIMLKQMQAALSTSYLRKVVGL